MIVPSNFSRFLALWRGHRVEYTSRFVLVILAGSMSYVVLLPSYNFAHFVPHNLLDHIGVDYAAQLWMEQHSDALLHFGGAASLVILLTLAALFPTSKPAQQSLLIVVLACILAEIAQFVIGRGFDQYDLLFGISGAFMAYLGVRFWVASSINR